MRLLWHKWLKKILIILAIAIAFGMFAYFALLSYISRKATQDTKAKSDAILVLGGHVLGGISCYGPICEQGFVPKPHYNPCLLARVDHAVSLYLDGYAPKILMSGGTDEETGINEAEAMKKMAVEAGVPEADIITENESHSTYENFLFSQRTLKETGLNSVIVVTDPYHNARAGLVAAKLRYQYSLSPVVESTCWEQDKDKPFTNRDSRREALALIVYKLLNRI